MNSIGSVIRDARLRSGLSQRAVARRASTSQAAISRIERGLEQPSFERAQQILAGMGWRLGLGLEPLAQSESDPERLHELRGRTPAERLEDGISWIRATASLAGRSRG